MNMPIPDHVRKALETVTLDDKYSLDHGRAFMSGIQALVKLPMLQRLRDQKLAGWLEDRVSRRVVEMVMGVQGDIDRPAAGADEHLLAQEGGVGKLGVDHGEGGPARQVSNRATPAREVADPAAHAFGRGERCLCGGGRRLAPDGRSKQQARGSQ